MTEKILGAITAELRRQGDWSYVDLDKPLDEVVLDGVFDLKALASAVEKAITDA
jgi:hypothetical protein